MTTTTKQPPPLVTPFTIVVDSNESAPFHFAGIPADGDRHERNWIVQTVTKPLWSMGRETVETPEGEFLHGLADYSIDGMEERVQIERKSISDLFSTLSARRREFQAEIARLDRCEYAAVVIEGDWSDIIQGQPNSQLLPKTVSRTILSWSMRWPRVHWWPCMNRRHAELMTFQLLRKFWEHQQG